MNTSFNDVLMSRRSIRNYDSNYPIAKEELTSMMNEALTAPSSFNMQPYKLLLVTEQHNKEKIAPLVQFNQDKVLTSSATIFVLGDYECFSNFEKIYSTAVDNGKMPQEVYLRQKQQLTSYYNTVSPQNLKERILLDAGILSMNIMLVARNHGYDTCPMGGFEKDKIVQALNLDEKRYFPVLMISIGKAADTGFPSVRLQAEDLIFWK